MKQATNKHFIETIISVLLFAAVLVILIVSTGQLTSSTDDEGLRATQEAIERAAVLCYATEGFYPPGLAYIEDEYGVQVDHNRYSVQYSVFASNVRPIIQVTKI